MSLVFKPREIKPGRPQKLNRRLDDFASKVYVFLRENLGKYDATKIWMAGQKIYDLNERARYYSQIVLSIQKHLDGQKPDNLREYGIYKYQPVGMREFVVSKQYLGKENEIYPLVLKEAEELNSGKYVEAILTGSIGCLSADTEFLTPYGWDRIDSWKGQLVGQYHPSTGLVDFVQPEFVELPCSEFWNFKTKYGLDMALSDEHKVLYRTSKGNLRTLTASEIAEQHQKSTYGFSGKFLTTFSVLRQGVKIADSQIRLQVAVQADGTFDETRAGDKVTLNIKKSRKKTRLKKLLSEAGVSYTESHLSSGYTRYYFSAPIKTKRFNWAWECSQQQLHLIADEVVHWDGNQKDTFYSTSKEDADFISYCFSATNKRAVTTLDDREGHCKCYVVRGASNIEITMQGTPKTEMQRIPSLDGKKYCFSVPTGFFVARRNGRVFITGNSGKTTLALFTTAYQLYLLSCLRNPQGTYKLDPSSEILFIFQSITKQLAKGVDYQRFRSMIEGSPYFQHNFPFRKDLESELVFPNRIIVRPVSGSDTAAIGQNVIGGVIDELNYMAVTEKSKQATDKGTYDQAVSVYNSIARRRKSRFMEAGKMPGILCLVSSKKYPGQFTDIKMEEAKTDPTIFIYDKRVWDIKPDAFAGKGWFNVFTGDLTRKPSILADDEEVSDEDRSLVVSVPLDFKKEFEGDIINALREIAGVSTLARHPFFMETDKVNASFRKEQPSIFSQSPVDFVQTRLSVSKSSFYKPELPRFVHVDLAITGDSAGLAIGTVTGFKEVYGDVNAFMPVFRIDGVLEIKPPKNSEILFTKIRQLLFTLQNLGMNIRWVTFDQFQSTDSQQILRQKGFVTGLQSMDIVPCLPYTFLKNAMYEERIKMPEHQHLNIELLQLEKDLKTGKIDHTTTGSKDCADALAGVVYGLTMRREIWSLYNIPLTMAPSNLASISDKMDKKNATVPEYQETFDPVESVRNRLSLVQ